MIVGGCGWFFGWLWIAFWMNAGSFGWSWLIVGGCGWFFLWLWVVVDGCGWFWVVVDSCGWLQVVAYFSITSVLLYYDDIDVIEVKGVDYHIIIHKINKSDAIHLLENSVFDDCGYIQNANQRDQY